MCTWRGLLSWFQRPPLRAGLFCESGGEDRRVGLPRFDGRVLRQLTHHPENTFSSSAKSSSPRPRFDPPADGDLINRFSCSGVPLETLAAATATASYPTALVDTTERPFVRPFQGTDIKGFPGVLDTFPCEQGKDRPSFPCGQGNTLKYILDENTKRPIPQGAPRSLQLPLDADKVVTLSGIRRSGKTSPPGRRLGQSLIVAVPRIKSLG